MVNSPKRSTSESVGARPRLARERRAASMMPTIQATPKAGPHQKSWSGREEGAGPDDRRRHAHADHIAPRGCQELGAVPTVPEPDAVPEPCLEDLVGRVDHGEAPAAAVRGIGDEHRQQHQDAHLDEDDAARASVLAAMQLRYSDPLIHAIQIRANTTAKEASPRAETWPASWWPPEPPLEAAVGLAGHGISRPPRRTGRILGGCPTAASVH